MVNGANHYAVDLVRYGVDVPLVVEIDGVSVGRGALNQVGSAAEQLPLSILRMVVVLVRNGADRRGVGIPHALGYRYGLRLIRRAIGVVRQLRVVLDRDGHYLVRLVPEDDHIGLGLIRGQRHFLNVIARQRVVSQNRLVVLHNAGVRKTGYDLGINAGDRMIHTALIHIHVIDGVAVSGKGLVREGDDVVGLDLAERKRSGSNALESVTLDGDRGLIRVRRARGDHRSGRLVGHGLCGAEGVTQFVHVKDSVLGDHGSPACVKRGVHVDVAVGVERRGAFRVAEPADEFGRGAVVRPLQVGDLVPAVVLFRRNVLSEGHRVVGQRYLPGRPLGVDRQVARGHSPVREVGDFDLRAIHESRGCIPPGEVHHLAVNGDGVPRPVVVPVERRILEQAQLHLIGHVGDVRRHDGAVAGQRAVAEHVLVARVVEVVIPVERTIPSPFVNVRIGCTRVSEAFEGLTAQAIVLSQNQVLRSLVLPVTVYRRARTGGVWRSRLIIASDGFNPVLDGHIS